MRSRGRGTVRSGSPSRRNHGVHGRAPGRARGFAGGRVAVVQARCRTPEAGRARLGAGYLATAQCGIEPWGEMKYFAGEANSRLLTREV